LRRLQRKVGRTAAGQRENDAEMIELYWMALLRDVP
jgi:hypothetical protein